MSALAEYGITPAAEEFLRQMAEVDRYLKAGLRPLTAMCAALDGDAELLVYAAAKQMAADILASAENIKRNLSAGADTALSHPLAHGQAQTVMDDR